MTKIKSNEFWSLSSESLDFFDFFIIFRDLKHPNIVNYFGIAPDCRAIFFELMNGSVSDFFGSKTLSIGDKLLITIQIACALKEIHQKGFIHRDIAARNVLLTKTTSYPTFIAKLGDFGKVCRSQDVVDSSVVVASKFFMIKKLMTFLNTS